MTTMLMVMIAIAFAPNQHNNGPDVLGVTIERKVAEVPFHNISEVEGMYLAALVDDSSFRIFPIQFRVVNENTDFLTSEFENRGVSFEYNPENSIGAYLNDSAVTTGESEGPQSISMNFLDNTYKVGFHIQSGNNIDRDLLKEARPVFIKITDAQGTVLYNEKISTCQSGEALCMPAFLGYESSSFISNITLTTEYPFSFSIADLYIEKI
jgi:hypothetical protein